MLYSIDLVMEKDIRNAVRIVNELGSSKNMLSFLRNYIPWEEHFKRNYSNDFTKALQPILDTLEILSPPFEMSNGEYRTRCESLLNQFREAEMGVAESLKK